MTRRFLIVTLLLAAGVSTFAGIISGRLLGGSPESAPAHVHAAVAAGQEVNPPEAIDGAKHPEFIPDSVAYRLFFLTVAEAKGGTAAKTVSGQGPASWPSCKGTYAKANGVRITGSDNYQTRYVHITPTVSQGQTVSAGQQIGTIDDSGCQSTDNGQPTGNRMHHVHIQRRDPSNNPVNFIIPCVNPEPSPGYWFWDGVTDDSDEWWDIQ